VERVADFKFVRNGNFWRESVADQVLQAGRQDWAIFLFLGDFSSTYLAMFRLLGDR
jgi:hypothetical protein